MVRRDRVQGGGDSTSEDKREDQVPADSAREEAQVRLGRSRAWNRPALSGAGAEPDPAGQGIPGQSIPGEETGPGSARESRSEEHTSELQSRQYLVCRLLLEKTKPFGGVLVETGVGPLAHGRLDEAFVLAIGARGLNASAFFFFLQTATGLFKYFPPEARPVVG